MKVRSVVKVSFVADDGREFDNEEECRTYENKTMLEKHVKFLDESFKPCCFDDCKFMIIKDRIGIKVVDNYCEANGFSTPWDLDLTMMHTGYFLYNEHKDEWTDIEGVLDVLKQCGDVYKEEQ